MFSESRFDDYPQLTRSTPRTSLHVQGRIAPARKAGSMRAKPVTAFSVRKTASKERSVVVMATDRSDAPEEGFVASTDGPTLGGFALPSAKSMALAVTGVTAAFVAQPMHILQMAFAGNGGDEDMDAMDADGWRIAVDALAAAMGVVRKKNASKELLSAQTRVASQKGETRALLAHAGGARTTTRPRPGT